MISTCVQPSRCLCRHSALVSVGVWKPMTCDSLSKGAHQRAVGHTPRLHWDLDSGAIGAPGALRQNALVQRSVFSLMVCPHCLGYIRCSVKF